MVWKWSGEDHVSSPNRIICATSVDTHYHPQEYRFQLIAASYWGLVKYWFVIGLSHSINNSPKSKTKQLETIGTIEDRNDSQEAFYDSFDI